MTSLSLIDIRRASVRLQKVIHRTPVLTSRYLDAVSGATVFLKCENFQRVGAFKFRGAYHAVSHLPARESGRPVVALSSGNHAQGIALAARLLGLRAIVVMPEPINPVKLAAVQEYGGVVMRAADRPHAQALVDQIMQDQRGHFVPAYNDPLVIAGQGTAALEFLEDIPTLDVMMAPVGGGGLLAGTSIAAHGLNSRVKIMACEPWRAMDAVDSIRENRIVTPHPADTIAEGLRTSLGELTLAILCTHIDGFFLVDEREIVEGVRVALERLKILIEPSSAVALAPLLRAEPWLRGKKVGVIVTGGNVDVTALLASWTGNGVRTDH